MMSVGWFAGKRWISLVAGGKVGTDYDDLSAMGISCKYLYTL